MSPKSQAWVQRLHLATAENLSNPEFSVLKLAETMDLSHAQLFRRIKETLGRSPNQYLREMRLQQAKLLLETVESSSVKAAAEAVGFKNPSHFAKLFKEHFGQTPSSLL